MKTISEALANSLSLLQAVSSSARLDAELLLAAVLDCDRVQVKINSDQVLSVAELQQYQAYVDRRAAGEPLAYILGTQEFWGLDFKVTPEVLIPRADTEILVATCLELIRKYQITSALELGAGSGAISIALASELTDVRIVAVDISTAALQVATENYLALKSKLKTSVQFIQSNWYAEVTGKFQLILANPPYIAVADPEVAVEVKQYEPHGALFASDNGYADLHHIIVGAKQYLEPQGWLVVEHGYRQARQVRDIMHRNGYVAVNTQVDLANHPRVTLGNLP